MCLIWSCVWDSFCRLTQIQGDVAFGARPSGWSFTLPSFAQLYCIVYRAKTDHKEFAQRLWREIYFKPFVLHGHHVYYRLIPSRAMWLLALANPAGPSHCSPLHSSTAMCMGQRWTLWSLPSDYGVMCTSSLPTADSADKHLARTHSAPLYNTS